MSYSPYGVYHASGQASPYAGAASPLPQASGSGAGSPPAFAAAPSAAFAPKNNKSAVPKGGMYANDGSFLDRFKTLRDDEKEKTDAQNAVARKKAMDDRFKRRGKRPAAEDASPSPSADPVAEPASKKAKSEAPPDDAYRRELAKSDNHSLKDTTRTLRS